MSEYADPRVPDGAMRAPRFMVVHTLDGSSFENHEEEELDLHNLIFVDGGSLLWYESPDTVAIMHARGGGEISRYQGTWEPKA